MLNELEQELKSERDETDNQKLKPDYRPHVELSADGGVAATGLVDAELIKSDEDLLRVAGLDPAFWVVDGATKKIWMHTDSRNRRSIYFGFHKRTQRNELAEWLASKFQGVEAKTIETADGAPLIVCLADMQTGKANEHNGGTVELVKRAEDVLSQLKALCMRERPEHIVIADLGDICEGTSNHTSQSQAAANDLPQSEQLRVAGRIIMEYVTTLAPFTKRVTIVGVRSNHAEERLQDGKVNGNGDYGVSLVKTIGDAIQLFGNINADTVTEKPLEHGVSITVDGATIAMFHGHYAKRVEKIGDWVASQSGGLRATIYDRAATVIHGHFHHLTVQESRGRMIYGCPALEGGSDWLTRATGEYSQPGVLTLRVRGGLVGGLRVFEPTEGVRSR